MTTRHDQQLLGAYVLGALDEQEVRAVEDHLSTCPECRAELDDLRAVEASLGDVPPEALLDGPPEGGDLLLQRTLRQMRTERGGAVRRRQFALGAAAAVVIAVVLGSGVVVGRSTAPQEEALPAPVTSTANPPAGTKVSSFTDPDTGAVMSVQVKPAAGWVRVNAAIGGIPQNEKCRLFVVAKDGHREEIGSWLVSKTGESEGTNLDGSALIAPDDVAAVEVVNFDGKKFVTVPV
ncbi:zf-HC2 domain-containing protein [Umezawaea sp. Da 62-37]|uniref:anti-sigma factor family protein n=1 Tax=Umezawaea sp. Da 62-37 TaxID=3075927 RepID=UPI0028F74F26|nr:zf-HC2 domain-containing protein [Umezawaea sp. Da 62-37]WNV89358.1 zf-HC2 domain-containing protein [Umezawaea sp. Da 62-37]